MTATSLTWQETTQMVGKLNRTLRGWEHSSDRLSRRPAQVRDELRCHDTRGVMHLFLQQSAGVCLEFL
jgi:hypothetical protein